MYLPLIIKGCDPSVNEFTSLSSHKVNLWPVWIYNLVVLGKKISKWFKFTFAIIFEGNENEDSLLTYIKTDRQ